MLEAHGRLVIPLVSNDDRGFALDRDGDSLTLLDPSGAVLDAIRFGRQIPHHTLARLPSRADRWGLCLPTPGAVNRRASATSMTGVQVNEIYAASGVAFDEDYAELLNLSPWPGDLTGVALTDDPLAQPDRFVFPPYTYMAANEFFVMDSSDLGFGLQEWFESLSLLHAATGKILDRVYWQGQGSTTTLGRFPDGSGSWITLSPGTPGRPNDNLQTFPTEIPPGGLGEPLAISPERRSR